ncbi:sensor histidine kinase [Fodinibius salsisoli]|uniref:histidine kinase n=1 Tax=Fodinibius salsisoli TaxID=2820877 RepID=A0ABT3PJM9_9BACT|nr:HAMP domain-containing sensor histidine kinase [Fodinibius salsisoli]MCW9705384.1 HAMP domain-containing histidine kinase [Fodinibius salsisoli]
MIIQNQQGSGGTAEMTLFDSIEPTFIVKMGSKIICKANDAAITRLGKLNPVGKELKKIVHTIPSAGPNITPAYFDGGWYELKQETFLWEGSQHLKIQLKQRDGVPGFDVMQSLKKMIGFLLHRVRSPLTGIQGYAELVKSNTDIVQSSKYLNKINEGIEELFDLLDELDTLQKISLTHVDLNNFSADPKEIVADILTNYSADINQNISYHNKGHNSPLRCNPGDLRRILALLIDNAVEFSPIEEYQVQISRPTANTIKVAHNGNPIPKPISDQLFYPFVTTTARKLGIGLTMALLYAKRYHGSIFVTDNNPFQETSFLLCLPPTGNPKAVSLIK